MTVSTDDILRLFQAARDAKSTTGLALALELATENARAAKAVSANPKGTTK